ncbi:glycosyltransferase [uncultured Roseobacter sp.]|uniref:glycosyltransferase n=1 Tax=uncultured Roseobacter sp. TaxID=114847 RepID=UPI0026352523|nr:glycosyltransferase [uncultured Roseobacter sp.]
MAARLKIVGLMRFSVLTPTYYAETFDTLDKAAAHLFSPERMTLRFRIFEALVLPSLLAQTDADFEMVILTADQLPEPWMTRLVELVGAVPNARLLPVGTDRHYQLLREGYLSVDTGDATHRVMFRLDDDDALSLDYISRLRANARGLLRLQKPDVPQVLAFNRGVYVQFRDGADNDVFDACERAPLSAGTALLAPLDYPRNPYRYNHRQLAQYYPTYSDISAPSFIRTVHGDNKSNPAQMGLTRQLRESGLERQLQRNFGVELADLREL